jgi:hypothetical protein
MSEIKMNVNVHPFSEGPFEGEIPDRDGWKVEAIMKDDELPAYQAFRETDKDDEKEWCLLTNRRFENLDKYASYKLLALIIKKIKENPDRKAVVLDLGGGALSTAARGMLKHPFLKGKIRCINIDMFAMDVPPEVLEEEGIEPDDLTVLNRDLADPNLLNRFLEGVADVVISHQVLDKVRDDRLPAVLGNVAGMIKPGGEAYLQEQWRITMNRDGFFGMPLNITPLPGVDLFPGAQFDEQTGLTSFEGNGSCYYTKDLPTEDAWLKKIAVENDVWFRSTYGETQLNGSTHLMGGGSGMIYMCKGYRSRQGRPSDMPTMNDFRLAWPEIVEAVKKYE